MLLTETLEKDLATEETNHRRKAQLYQRLMHFLPKRLLEYDWDKVYYSPYASGWSMLNLYLKRDDPATTAVITAWLVSLFDDIKVSKPQISSYSKAAYVEANTKLGEDELKIQVTCYHTGECKKIRITKQVPEEVTEAHEEEEYAIICAGEELPEGAEVLED
jgi:hypothetical protein